MTLLDTFNTIAEKDLASYIKELDYTAFTSDEAVNTMLALIEAEEWATAKIIADYYILNGFTFSRSSIVPGIITYTTGEVPYIKLKFVEILKKLYWYYETASYNTEAESILSRLNTNMIVDSGDYDTVPLSTLVLLYDAGGELVPSWKSGTYISECNPYAWYLSSYEDEAEDIVEMFFDSQNDHVVNAGQDGIFKTFYIRNLTESLPYGTADTFTLQDSPISTEKSFYHQYETVLNTAKYYRQRFKNEGYKDLTARAVLDRFLTAVNLNISSNTYPYTLSQQNITLARSDIYLSATNITLGTLSTFVVTNQNDISYLAKLGLAMVHKFKVDNDVESFTLAQNIYNLILALQQSDGSIQESTISIANQAQVLEFISVYNRLHCKNYYEIINSALNLFQIDNISDKNSSTHDYSSAKEFCNQGLEEILQKRYFENTEENPALTYSAGTYTYTLADLNIDSRDIKSVEYIQNNSLNRLDLISYAKYIELKTQGNTASRPYCYTINPDGKYLYLYPPPNQDYSFYINTYKQEEYLTDFNNYPVYLKPEWYSVLKYYIAWKIATERRSGLIEVYNYLFTMWMGNMLKQDAVDLSEKEVMPRAFGFGGGNRKAFRGFSSIEGR